MVEYVASSSSSTVSVKKFPVTITSATDSFKPRTLSASNVPPSIVPPAMAIVPSGPIVADNPASLIPCSKSPIVESVPTVIVWYSLFEFLTITVELSVIPSPPSRSFSKLSSVAIIVSVTVKSSFRLPVC